MTQPRFSVGDLVRVRQGVADHDNPDLPLAGWCAVVENVLPHSPGSSEPFYDIIWTRETLTLAHPIYRELTELLGLSPELYSIGEADLEPDPGTPLQLATPDACVLAKYEKEKRLRDQFDFHRDEPHEDERIATLHEKELVGMFRRSSKFDALDEGSEELLNILPVFLEYARIYHGVTAVAVTPAIQAELLLKVFPRKMMTDPGDALPIVEELRAFWRFVERDLHHAPAAACRAQLTETFSRQLERQLNDPSNFGMGKALLSQGRDAGFDISSEEGLAQWMRMHNLMQADALSSRAMPGQEAAKTPRPAPRPQDKKTRKKRKDKRKAQRKQRKRNR